MSLTHADVKKIAKLARIRIEDAEVPKLTQELSGIFNWIEQLAAVNIESVPPMAGVGDYTLRFREDNVTDGGNRDAVLANAPEASFGCFVVPRVVE